ncbi:3'-5' exonuclease DinG-like [Hydra vulgaris]|uniref:3'-5' exonuclease DinG-like n=1 Tax=Hydra vulgaris TaxID=6087 RepID=A0ABM4C419_HYDVU
MAELTNSKPSEYFLENVIFIDIEATGLYPSTDRIVQIAMLKIKCNGLIETYHKYINPCMPKAAQMEGFKIHHISPEMLSKENTFASYVQEIYDFIGETKYLCAHSVWSDWNYLFAEFTRSGKIWANLLASKNITLIDTHKLTIKAFPNCGRQSLQSLANYLSIVITHNDVNKIFDKKENQTKEDSLFKNESVANLHDARTDIMVTKLLMFKAIEKLFSQTHSKLFSIEDIVKKHPYSATKTTLLELLDKFNDETDNESNSLLLDLANNRISSLNSSRGKLIKDLSSFFLQQEIFYFSKNLKDINKEREVKLRKLILKHKKT